MIIIDDEEGTGALLHQACTTCTVEVGGKESVVPLPTSKAQRALVSRVSVAGSGRGHREDQKRQRMVRMIGQDR